MSENESIITNKQIYDELIKTKKELKQIVEETEVRFLLKLEEFNKRLSDIETENREIKTKFELLERNVRKNNILVFGLKEEVNVISPEYICDKLNQILEVNLNVSDLNNVYTLGKGNGPVKVEFLTYLKKISVIKKTSKLKGTGISIAQDLTIKQREENKILKKHLQLARQQKNIKCYIKQNKLYLNENAYTAEELKKIEGTQGQLNNIQERPTSATGVKNIRNPGNLQETEEPNEDETTTSDIITIKCQDSPNSKKTGAIKKTSKENNTLKMTTRHRPGVAK